VNALAQNDKDRAEYFFLQALEEETSKEICLALAALYASLKGKENEAFRFYRRSLAFCPDNGDIMNDCGAMLMRSGDEMGALRWFQRALHSKNCKRKHYVFYNLAILYYRWNRPERSIRYLNLALRIDPGFQAALALMNNLKQNPVS